MATLDSTGLDALVERMRSLGTVDVLVGSMGPNGTATGPHPSGGGTIAGIATVHEFGVPPAPARPKAPPRRPTIADRVRSIVRAARKRFGRAPAKAASRPAPKRDRGLPQRSILRAYFAEGGTFRLAGELQEAARAVLAGESAVRALDGVGERTIKAIRDRFDRGIRPAIESEGPGEGSSVPLHDTGALGGSLRHHVEGRT